MARQTVKVKVRGFGAVKSKFARVRTNARRRKA